MGRVSGAPGWKGFHQAQPRGRNTSNAAQRKQKNWIMKMATSEKHQRCVLETRPGRLKSQPPTFPQKCFLITLTTFQIACLPRTPRLYCLLRSNQDGKSMPGERTLISYFWSTLQMSCWAFIYRGSKLLNRCRKGTWPLVDHFGSQQEGKERQKIKRMGGYELKGNVRKRKK